jgi:hypothetical protein
MEDGMICIHCGCDLSKLPEEANIYMHKIGTCKIPAADPEIEQRPGYEIDESMIWAAKIEDNQYRVYLNEFDTLTFSESAANAIFKALRYVLEKLPVDSDGR